MKTGARESRKVTGGSTGYIPCSQTAVRASIISRTRPIQTGCLHVGSLSRNSGRSQGRCNIVLQRATAAFQQQEAANIGEFGGSPR